AFQASTSVGRSVMTTHALVAARRMTRQRRRGGAQRSPGPANPDRYGDVAPNGVDTPTCPAKPESDVPTQQDSSRSHAASQPKGSASPNAHPRRADRMVMWG